MTTKTHKFKKGDVVHLDTVYNLIGVIPLDTYNQDDIGDTPGGYHVDGNDSGETLRFIKNVTIKIDVKVT